MTRRLMLLNFALLAMLAILAYRFKAVNAAARDREARTFGQKIEPRKYPPLPAAPGVTPAVGANYIDIATHMLLAKDRNPNVIIDPEPVKEKPRMPPLPVVQGLMNFGDPGLIMSDKPGAAQKTYHKGEKVGPFKLLAFDSEHVVLDWDGEKVDKKLDELLEKGPSPPPPGAGPAGASAAPSVANAAPPSAAPQGPGADIGGGFKGCQPNDSTPSGTVQNGLRKVEIATPFGKSCRWEPAK